MKKIVLRFIILIALMIGVDFVFGLVFRSFIEHTNPTSYYGEINYAMTKCEADFVVLGASTAKSHYYPIAIEDSTGLSVFNAGSDGKNILYYCCVGEEIIKRGKTKHVVLDLVASEMQLNNLDRLSALNPWYGYSENVNNTINLKSKFEFVKMQSNFYSYNSSFMTILFNVLRSDDKSKIQGYRRIDGVAKDMKLEAFESDAAVSDIAVDRLVNFILLCKSQNVDLSISISPSYFVIDPNMPSLIKIAELCSEYEVPFYNYSDMFLAHPEYFKDDMHMNHTGASLFTEHFIHDALMK